MADVFLSYCAQNRDKALSLLGAIEASGHEDALAATQEAVDIRRALAAARPDAFRPELAKSVSVMSDVLAALERHGEAAAAAQEALALLAPFVKRYPEQFRGLARTIMSDVVRYSEASGVEPDAALMGEVGALVGSPDADEAQG